MGRYYSGGMFLKDEKIENDLAKLPNLYKDGEIAEVKDILLEIYAAIDEWENNNYPE